MKGVFMIFNRSFFYIALFLFPLITVLGQSNTNCFLEDFQIKEAVIPPYTVVDKTTDAATVFITINPADTLGEVSKYVFGNAVAVWVSSSVNNSTIVGHLKKMGPSLIRFPGGSWSDQYFWKGNPGDLPTQVPDGQNGGKMVAFWPQYSSSYSLTVDSYYDLCKKIGANGLITVNYGYARYGLSAKPAEQAAHYAADWVRYDNGRTKFWEIGNESAGPWSGGWMIDTSRNKDGQPQIVNGQLYGQHFKIFADSMRTAAAEKGVTIYIGGQVIQYDGTNSWNAVDRKWNEEFFKEVGNAADFYVIHNYFGNSAATLKAQIDNARSEIIKNVTFVSGDIKNKKAFSKPIALTEWNSGGPDQAKTSIANGMQAVTLFSEMIKNNFGMSCRWLVANWESDGLFYYGNNSSLRWQPRPDFYYIYYLQKFTGDHSVGVTITGSSDILSYVTMFSGGHEGVVVVNKGSKDQVLKIRPGRGVGQKYYVYSLVGGDAQDFSQTVMVNDEAATGTQWGPIDRLESIEANAYTIGDNIVFKSPARSVQYVMVEPGDNIVSVENNEDNAIPSHYELNQNYPNPFNPQTTISYSLPQESNVSLKVFDILGREVADLLQNKFETAGYHEVTFDGLNVPSGIYFYQLTAADPSQSSGQSFVQTKKMILIK